MQLHGSGQTISDTVPQHMQEQHRQQAGSPSSAGPLVSDNHSSFSHFAPTDFDVLSDTGTGASLHMHSHLL